MCTVPCVNVYVLLFAHHSGRVKICFVGLVQHFEALLLTVSLQSCGKCVFSSLEIQYNSFRQFYHNVLGFEHNK